jgi:hypothetical protein
MNTKMPVTTAPSNLSICCWRVPNSDSITNQDDSQLPLTKWILKFVTSGSVFFTSNSHHSEISTKATSSSTSYLSSPAKDTTFQMPPAEYLPDYASNSNQPPPGGSNSAQAAPGSASTGNSVNPDVATILPADSAIQTEASPSINPVPSTTPPVYLHSTC